MQIDKFWSRMRSIWGADIWDRKYPMRDCAADWQEAILDVYDDVQIVYAQSQCIAHYPDRPPTMPAFRALCVQSPAPAIPALTAMREKIPAVADEWIADLRGIIAQASHRKPMSDAERERIMTELGMGRRLPRHVEPGSFEACSYPNCASPGTQSGSTSGGDRFWCREHFRG